MNRQYKLNCIYTVKKVAHVGTVTYLILDTCIDLYLVKGNTTFSNQKRKKDQQSLVYRQHYCSIDNVLHNDEIAFCTVYYHSNYNTCCTCNFR